MRVAKLLLKGILFISLISVWGCAYHQSFTKGDEIRSKARSVAVLPLVNLTSYPYAGRIAGELLSTELYALTTFQITERTEMQEKLRGSEDDLDQVVEKVVALKVGKLLGVDTVIYGSVTEYAYKRGLDEDPVVGITVRMLDVKEGSVLWAGSESRTGGCFWLCEDSLSLLAQKVCHDMVMRMLRAD